jgi:hypothetical protein
MAERTRNRFPTRLLDAISAAQIIGLRAGTQPHRIIGLWVVVAHGRVFVRSWGVSSRGWYRTLLEHPEGLLTVGARKVRIRAIHTRSEALKHAVDLAFAQKYHTPASRRIVRQFRRKKSRNATLELAPQRPRRALGGRRAPKGRRGAGR